MIDVEKRIEHLEYTVADLKKELRRIKSTNNKLEKIGLPIPNELKNKQDDVETNLKECKQELKALKKVAELIK